MKIKTKIGKWELTELKASGVKETINQMKTQTTDQEKIFANEATDKGLI